MRKMIFDGCTEVTINNRTIRSGEWFDFTAEKFCRMLSIAFPVFSGVPSQHGGERITTYWRMGTGVKKFVLIYSGLSGEGVDAQSVMPLMWGSQIRTTMMLGPGLKPESDGMKRFISLLVIAGLDGTVDGVDFLDWLGGDVL